jgi:hypothetical protein
VAVAAGLLLGMRYKVTAILAATALLAATTAAAALLAGSPPLLPTVKMICALQGGYFAGLLCESAWSRMR